ncbi:hypothetical protein C923_02841 [Plasmodium falciparum UGT5.1]|nr:hypothetical protein C923_02841 [Plasmodium falciparum UGT5.1]
MWMKNTSGKTKINAVNSLLVYFTFILPLVNRIILIKEESFRSDIFIQLLFEFALTFILSIITKFIFSSQLNVSHEHKNATYSDDEIYQVNKDLKKKDKKKKKN